jgi:hypothetical protein
MDAGTEFDAALDWHAGVALDEAIPSSIGWRRKFRVAAIACAFDDAP